MRCSYCHDGLPALWVCPRCRTVLHADCQQESHVCPSLGCDNDDPAPTPGPSRSRSALLGLLWVGAAASLTLASSQLYEHVNPKPVTLAPAPPLAAPPLEPGDPGDPRAAQKMQRFLRALMQIARDHDPCEDGACGWCTSVDRCINGVANAWAKADRTDGDLPSELTYPRPSTESLGFEADAALEPASRGLDAHRRATAVARAFFLRLAGETQHLPSESVPECSRAPEETTCSHCQQLRRVVQAASYTYAE